MIGCLKDWETEKTGKGQGIHLQSGKSQGIFYRSCKERATIFKVDFKMFSCRQTYGKFSQKIWISQGTFSF